MENQTQITQPKRKRRKRISRGTIAFYSIYIVVVASVLILFHVAMGPLESWLTRYENSQPEYTAEEIYATLFADPDWDLIYDLAGVENTTYEGKDEFIAYMEEKVGSTALTYQETSAGLSGGKKYIVKLGSEKLATFSMSSEADGGFDVWQLSAVEVFFTRTEDAAIVTMPEYTVCVNGVALDDSFTTYSVSTVAEAYLPEGLHGYRAIRQEISGLLVEPEITVLDENGVPVEVTYDAENDLYCTVILTTPEMTEEYHDIALAAAKANAEYAIRAISAGTLRQYFDPNSQVYTDISTTAVFLQSYQSYSFDESVTQVTDFYQYSNDFFSARVTLKMDIVRSNGTIKVYDMDTTYFFTRNTAGSWMVTDITNVHIQEEVTSVRLTFVQDDQTLMSEMVEADVSYLTLPEITAPEGQTLLGWAKQEVDEDGNIIYTIVLPAEHGVAYFPEGHILEPMTLYPVFDEVQ